MKITQVTATPLAIPYRQNYQWSGGHTAGVNPILIRIDTDEGVHGLGEASGDRSVAASLGVIESARERLLGEDPFSVERFFELFYRVGKWAEVRKFAHQAVAGVEMALWDIIGKVCDQPVSRLLGGSVRERISVFGFPQGDSPEAVAEDAQRLVQSGFPILYLKVGRPNNLDIEYVSAVRRYVGDGPRIRLDANQAWSVGEAIVKLRGLADFEIEFAEQPVGWADFAGMARVRAAVPMPIAIDQSCFTEFDVLATIQAQSADVVVLGPHDTGGLLPLKKAAAIAAAGNLPLCRHGVSGESGITTLAALQVLATIPNLTDGNQCMHQLLEADIVAPGVLRFEQGALEVPSRPGLGIVLDDDLVTKYARLFTARGPYHNAA